MDQTRVLLEMEPQPSCMALTMWWDIKATVISIVSWALGKVKKDLERKMDELNITIESLQETLWKNVWIESMFMNRAGMLNTSDVS